MDSVANSYTVDHISAHFLFLASSVQALFFLPAGRLPGQDLAQLSVVVSGRVSPTSGTSVPCLHGFIKSSFSRTSTIALGGEHKGFKSNQFSFI